uniref:DUF569 domain-containing protein n=1 Tax=Oryza barthii TaxID=65489 RepID=A0A0D3GWP2_9ORYZ
MSRDAFKCTTASPLSPSSPRHATPRHATPRSRGSGRYLRGKLGTLVLGGRPRLTVGDGRLNDDEKALRWEVLPVLPIPGRPELPISIVPEADLVGRLVKACFLPLRREIQFVAADDDGNIREGQEVWDSFQYEGWSVQLLRNELEDRVGYAITVCVRAGRHGQHSPLLINLPHSRETLHIVVLRRNSEAPPRLCRSLAFLATPRHAAPAYVRRPIRGGARGMEVFQGVQFARLRNWWEETYVTADEDGRSVYHYAPDRHRPAHEAIWAVQPGSPRRSTCSSAAPTAIMWRAVRRTGHVVCLHDKSGRYLRGKLMSTLVCGGRPSLTVGDGRLSDDEKELRWEVRPVLPSPGRPELPIATEADLAELFVKICFPPRRREIQFVAPDGDGNIVWDSFQYQGRSVQLLRNELENRVGYAITVCVRAGRHGRLTPLLINLPHSRETLHIVSLRRNSEADDQLLFPNLNALLLLSSVTSHISGSSSSDRGYAVSGSNGLRLPLITLRPNETAPQSSTPHNAYTLPLTASGTAATAKADEEIWNKRQIGYVYILSTSLAVLFLAQPFLPAGYDGWMLAAFASVWGLGNVGLPCGMFGERIGKSFSRHVGHILYMTFSALVIYGIYLLAVHADPTHSASVPALALPSLGLTWEGVFGLIGVLVSFGHLFFWVKCCYTGVDRDREA